jgi:hypothetical protein
LDVKIVRLFGFVLSTRQAILRSEEVDTVLQVWLIDYYPDISPHVCTHITSNIRKRCLLIGLLCCHPRPISLSISGIPSVCRSAKQKILIRSTGLQSPDLQSSWSSPKSRSDGSSLASVALVGGWVGLQSDVAWDRAGRSLY